MVRPVSGCRSRTEASPFTVLLPKRLVPFSLASVGTYVLFLPQHTFVALIGGLM